MHFREEETWSCRAGLARPGHAGAASGPARLGVRCAGALPAACSGRACGLAPEGEASQPCFQQHGQKLQAGPEPS